MEYKTMYSSCFHCFWGLLFLPQLPLCFVHSTTTSSSDHVYIVYLGLNQYPDQPNLTSKSHIRLLSTVFASEEDAKRSMLYSYKHSFSGFSAKLNSSQATSLAKMEGVTSVFEGRTLELHTTRSWDFLGLSLNNIDDHDKDDDDDDQVTPLQLAYGDDIIVGVLDTGVWPESESFQENEQCLGPIPSCWKGTCVEGENFDPKKACNRKLIGARYYIKGFEETFGPLNTSSTSETHEYRSPRDFLGHGTHTASTAVGSVVKNASFLGLGRGTARGGAPRARLAVYKVCWGWRGLEGKCSEADILAAFDEALHDGVHVISASIGEPPPLRPFFASSADIGSFHAMQRGVSVVFSAGNDDTSRPSTVQNVAPWSLSVAASSIDRTFPTQIVVNCDFSLTGQSFIITEIKARLANAPMYFFNGVCKMESWNEKPATGKVVICFSKSGQVVKSEAAAALKKANATALIFVEPTTLQIPEVLDVLPIVLVDIAQGTQLQYNLAQFRKLPTVQLKPTKTRIGKTPAPVVAYFSSRGPSSISPDILKPDVTAPGTSILAAWPPCTPPTLDPADRRSVNWNFQSGTSMSCPHVSGVVALIKSAHPSWSPAAIRSAIMTTAMTKDTTQDRILAGGSMKVSDPLDLGSGHINPIKAMDPGLVYDLQPNDYILFLCNTGYTRDNIQKIVIPLPGTKTACAQTQKHKPTNTHINYPSITASSLQSTMTVKRRVRNVGAKKNVVYFCTTILEPDGVEVLVWPRILIFSFYKEELSFYVTLKPVKVSQDGRYDFGEIVWSDGFHHVRSPLVVSVNNTVIHHHHYNQTITHTSV